MAICQRSSENAEKKGIDTRHGQSNSRLEGPEFEIQILNIQDHRAISDYLDFYCLHTIAYVNIFIWNILNT